MNDLHCARLPPELVKKTEAKINTPKSVGEGGGIGNAIFVGLFLIINISVRFLTRKRF